MNAKKAVGWAALVACAVAGADVAVDDHDILDVILTNATTQTETIYVAGEADRVEKGGAGAWTLDAAQLVTSASAAPVVAVREGALNIVGGAAATARETPTAVLNRAAAWFDASRADTLVSGTSATNTGVAAWYDARETKSDDGTWGHAYYCATARTSWVTNEVSEGTWETVVFHPVAKTYDAMPGVAYVDFNGRKSGTWMGFCAADAARTPLTNSTLVKKVQHIFFTGYVTNAWGFPISSSGGDVWLHPLNTDGTLGAYGSTGSTPSGVLQGRTVVNGNVIDPTVVSVARGPYVYEWDAGDLTGCLNAFFNDRGLWAPSYWRAGGDSLGEVLIFTNSLTTLEREHVSRYLLGKWRPAATAKSQVDVRTAVGAEVTVADDATAAVNALGAGTLNVAGRTQAFSATTPDAAATHVGAAGAVLAAAEPRLALRAGDAFTVTRDTFDNLAFTPAEGTADAATLALPASAAVRVAELPDTVKRLAVSGAGELVLGALPSPSAVKATGDIYATMPNADFEEITTTGIGYWSAGQTYSSWRVVSTVASPSPVNYSVYKNGTGNCWLLDGGARSRFPYADYDFQGNIVLVLKKGAVIENTVTFPADGDYELTFLTAGRADGINDQYAGGWVKMSLVDGAGAETAIGTALGLVGAHTRKQRFLVRGVRAGAYTFRLNHDVGGNDAHTVLDDFRFRLVTDVPMETLVYPPNADFEQIASMTWATRYSRQTTHTLTDWTFTQSDAAATNKYNPDVCLLTRGMTNADFRDGAAHGGVQLAFYGNAGVATSAAFTLPAGTWKLRLLLAAALFDGHRWNGKMVTNGADVQADLVDDAGEVVAALGTSGKTWRGRLKRQLLPTAVTFATPRTVRLRLKGACALSNSSVGCAVVDDLEFVRQDGVNGELVKNGTFADTSVWTLRSNTDTTTETTTANTKKNYAAIWDPCRIVENAYAYGVNYGLGTSSLDICQCAGAEQDVTFPAAGAYRLTFSARSRTWFNRDGTPATWANYGGNQAQFYLVDGTGATNEIYRTPSLYSTNFVFRSALFTVPAAGTYRFGIRGLNGLPLADGTTLKVGANPKDTEFFIDQVSVKPATEEAFGFEPKLALDLRDTAALRLDFTGTNEVASLRLGGRAVVGYIDASHASGLVRGTGCLFVRPRNTVILLR